MSLAYVMLGMVLGLVSAVSVWMAGAGVLMALLAYSCCGALGTVLAVALAHLKQDAAPAKRSVLVS